MNKRERKEHRERVVANLERYLSLYEFTPENGVFIRARIDKLNGQIKAYKDMRLKKNMKKNPRIKKHIFRAHKTINP